MDVEEAIKKFPFCATCNIMMQCIKNDVLIELLDEEGEENFFHADLFRCSKCGAATYFRFSQELDDSWKENEQIIHVDF